MKEPKIGTKSVCKMCGEEIEYIGPYWRHTKYTPRHPAIPKDAADKAKPDKPA